jgi:hypothetical protein
MKQGCKAASAPRPAADVPHDPLTQLPLAQAEVSGTAPPPSQEVSTVMAAPSTAPAKKRLSKKAQVRSRSAATDPGPFPEAWPFPLQLPARECRYCRP